MHGICVHVCALCVCAWESMGSSLRLCVCQGGSPCGEVCRGSDRAPGELFQVCAVCASCVDQ